MEVRPDIKIVVVASSPAEDPALLAMAHPAPLVLQAEAGGGPGQQRQGDRCPHAATRHVSHVSTVTSTRVSVNSTCVSTVS